MKKLLLSILSLSAAGMVYAQPTARLQVIHNSAVPAADTVDVYANGELLLNDVAFRTATPYVPVPAGVDIRIGVALKGSNRAGGGGILDTIAAAGQTINLIPEGTFVAIANGLLSVAKPDIKAFQIFAAAGSESTAGSNVGLKFFHGATDAPAVDIVARGVATLAADLSYGEFSPTYVSVPATSYTIDVNPAGLSTPVASYTADLTTLGGGSAVVLASGFLAPTGSEQGFEVIAVLPNGAVITLPTIITGLFETRPELNNSAVYPNPAINRININNDFVTSMEFSDHKGTIVKRINSPVSSSLDVSDLARGIYVIKMVRNNTVEIVKLTISE